MPTPSSSSLGIKTAQRAAAVPPKKVPGRVYYVHFPQHQVEIAGATGGGGTSVIDKAVNWFKGNTNWSGKAPFGHAAIITRDNDGRTKYFEYGRYKDGNLGYSSRENGGYFGNFVRRPVPDFKGMSDEEYVRRLGKTFPGEPKIELYGADSEDIGAAERYIQDMANDRNREPYSVGGNNCGSVARRAFDLGRGWDGAAAKTLDFVGGFTPGQNSPWIGASSSVYDRNTQPAQAQQAAVPAANPAPAARAVQAARPAPAPAAPARPAVRQAKVRPSGRPVAAQVKPVPARRAVPVKAAPVQRPVRRPNPASSGRPSQPPPKRIIKKSELIRSLEKAAGARIDIPKIYGEVKSRYGELGYPVTGDRLLVSKQPTYSNGKPVPRSVMSPNESGGNTQDDGTIRINPEYRKVMDKWKLKGSGRDFLRMIIGHEIGHHIDRTVLQRYRRFERRRLLNEIAARGFSTTYTDSYDKYTPRDRMDKELIAEYLASMVHTYGRMSTTRRVI